MARDRNHIYNAMNRQIQGLTAMDFDFIAETAAASQEQFRPMRREDSTDSTSILERAEDHLQQAASELLNDEDSSDLRQSGNPFSGIDLEERRLRKRRKLESDDRRDRLGIYSDGWHGQVVSSPLDLIVSSCNPGTSNEPMGGFHCPENVLDRDGTTYRANSGRCRILLKHSGPGPFSLKRLVIRTPRLENPDDMDVRTGLVCVSMNDAPHYHRATRTAPAPAALCPFRRDRDRPRRTVDNPWPFHFPSHQFHHPGNRGPPATAESRADELPPLSPISTTSPEPDEQPSDETGRGLPAQDHLSDSESDSSDDNASNFRGSDSDSSEGNPTTTESFTRNLIRQRQLLHVLGVRFAGAQDQKPQERQPPIIVRAPKVGDDRDPHASFSFDKNMHAVHIKFDPPVSGRYILVKMCSPKTFEIESIVAHGFTGPRFFPAIEFR
ncbi:hypothetical protein FQN57_004090 [Myotisia sp. PD_48]|nr:hypothetical protein FQN57_004090 [Myotisia sp. PD_48]